MLRLVRLNELHKSARWGACTLATDMLLLLLIADSFALEDNFSKQSTSFEEGRTMSADGLTLNRLRRHLLNVFLFFLKFSSLVCAFLLQTVLLKRYIFTWRATICFVEIALSLHPFSHTASLRFVKCLGFRFIIHSTAKQSFVAISTLLCFSQFQHRVVETTLQTSRL